MTEPRRDDERLLHDLLASLLDGSITESQHLELQNRLRDDPASQQTYFDYLDLDTDLREMSMNQSGIGFQPVSITTSLEASTKTRHRTRLTGWNRLLIGLAIAASLLLIASFAWRHHDDQVVHASSDDVVLVQSAGAELYREVMPAVGQALQSHHEYALTAGLIELKFPSGAEVILEAPSVIEIAGRDRLIVKVGACSVYAPPGAEGFRVETPQADVIDLGTRFSVNVNEVGETDVQVMEGAADVQLRNEPANSTPMRLTDGDSRRFRDKEEGDSQPLPFDAELYRRELPDRVVSYEARTDQDGHVDALLKVTMQRGGRRFVYPVDDLIGVDVTHFRAGINGHNIAVSMHGNAERQDASRLETADSALQFTEMAARGSVLESDTLLNTGIINPGGATTSLISDPDADTPGMEVRFREPVVNGPGPDVVFFEVQSVINPPHGDAFHVSPLKFAPRLRSHTISRYDITMFDAAAKPLVGFVLRTFEPPPPSLQDFLQAPMGQHRPTLRFLALAVGIDLSDLGYSENAEVSGLFIQDAADDDEHQVDPVFIAGLPYEKTAEVAP